MKVVKAIAIVLLLIVGCLTGCLAQQQSQPPEQPSSEQSYLYEHFTIYPQDNEASFKLAPNSICSVIFYIEAGQSWDKSIEVSYMLSPINARSFMAVNYVTPDGCHFTAAGRGELPHNFKIHPHGDGYYSIIFSYCIPEGEPIPPSSLLPDVDVCVRYDIQ